MGDKDGMEPPKKRWKINEHNKEILARDLAYNTLLLQQRNNYALPKHLFTNDDFAEDTTFKGILSQYTRDLEDDKVYETNHPLELVYYKFTTPEKIILDESDNTEKKDLLTSGLEIRGFDPNIFFTLNFRHYFRILRRLVYFSYIHQGMIEECTRFDLKSSKIKHKFYGDNMTSEVSDRIARSMNLDDYMRYHESREFKIEKVEETEEEQKKGITLEKEEDESPHMEHREATT